MPVRGARAALRALSKTDTALGRWRRGPLRRAHKNAVVVALAAKLARVVCAVALVGFRGGGPRPVSTPPLRRFSVGRSNVEAAFVSQKRFGRSNAAEVRNN